MGFFSKKITTDKITGSLVDFFDVGYGSLVVNFKDTFKDLKISIKKEQDKELLIVPMLAITQAVLMTFKDMSKTEAILSKFQLDVVNQYFKDEIERNKFKELFSKRCRDEYSEILNPENKDLGIQFGQIFCNHFFGKKEDGSHFAVMMFVGMSFLNQIVETKKFLDEILSKYEVI
ncbi:hypothetical protein KKF38_00820 [Patescibacteria group bacterium]|nr:hypothetical protein [Patescibacteria group bacterium]